MIPAWVSWQGLALHVAFGAALAWLLTRAGAPPAAVLVAVSALAVAHEQAQLDALGRTFSDFRSGNPGAPWNGALDVLAFLAGAPLGLWLP